MGAPARAHVQPGGSYWNPTGPPGPPRRRHWSPEEGSACIGSGELDAGARSPLWRLRSRCHSPGCARHSAGLRKESLRRDSELGMRREGLATGRKLGTSTLGPQGPHPGTTLAYVGGGAAARPGPACERWWCHRRDWLSVPGLASELRTATLPSAARSARAPELPSGQRVGEVQQLSAESPGRRHFRKRAGRSQPRAPNVPRSPRPQPGPQRAPARHLGLCMDVGRQPDQPTGLAGRDQD